jgi:hypothetical protein
MGIYNLVESFNNKEIFKNIVIVLVFLFFFIKIPIGLNILLALFLAVVCIIYLKERETYADIVEDEQFKRKQATIKPKPKYFNNDKDMIDFLFSVQDFYVFNPPAFEEIIDNLDAFKVLERSIFDNPELSNYYYQIAESKLSNALNAFHSIIFNLPNNQLYTEKFNRAHKRLQSITNKHLNEIYDQCTYNLKKDGYSVTKRAILTGPKEFNTYHDKNFTYQFY